MMDDKNHPKHLWPTHDRILHQIGRLTSDAPEDFSGHCLKEDCPQDRASMRADGKDDEIVCADAKPIPGHILHDRLVEPLRNVKGSKLFTLFDCCYSECLLDLKRGIGPNKYSRVWKIGPGQLFIGEASTKWRSPPASKTEEVGELSVICLSACRDGQLAHDDCERELTFTKSICDLEIRRLIRSTRGLVADIQARYDETYLLGSSSESDVTHETWTQEPRDLTRKVSL
ncbi:hypothetical protein HD554DRAFT_2107086 [Boletus coccyginus]|nr:hypothetical protein HD554DRAFT_2107086 [Boletus coccyginus]